jgi:hypothetical protein
MARGGAEPLTAAAFRLQAEVEASLRMTEDAIDGDAEDGTRMWGSAGATAVQLGQLLSPFDTRSH